MAKKQHRDIEDTDVTTYGEMLMGILERISFLPEFELSIKNYRFVVEYKKYDRTHHQEFELEYDYSEESVHQIWDIQSLAQSIEYKNAEEARKQEVLRGAKDKLIAQFSEEEIKLLGVKI